MKKNNKGFSLAELLIVVAIIAVLVAIAIPVFTTQLEKSREATDVANIRSAYADLMTNYLTEPKSKTISLTPQAQVSGWQTNPEPKLKTLINGTEDSVTIADTSKGIKISITKEGVVTVTN